MLRNVCSLPTMDGTDAPEDLLAVGTADDPPSWRPGSHFLLIAFLLYFKEDELGG